MKRKYTLFVAGCCLAIGLGNLMAYIVGGVDVFRIVADRPGVAISTSLCFMAIGRVLQVGVRPVSKHSESEMIAMLFFVLGMMSFSMTDMLMWFQAREGLVLTMNTPSLGTLIAFLAYVSGNLLSLLTTQRASARLCGVFTAVMGSMGIIGHILRLPALYFEQGGVSRGMAILTAALFILIGTALYLPGEAQEKE